MENILRSLLCILKASTLNKEVLYNNNDDNVNDNHSKSGNNKTVRDFLLKFLSELMEFTANTNNKEHKAKSTSNLNSMPMMTAAMERLIHEFKTEVDFIMGPTSLSESVPEL